MASRIIHSPSKRGEEASMRVAVREIMVLKVIIRSIYNIRGLT
jgi:hypothetical protein